MLCRGRCMPFVLSAGSFPHCCGCVAESHKTLPEANPGNGNPQPGRTHGSDLTTTRAAAAAGECIGADGRARVLCGFVNPALIANRPRTVMLRCHARCHSAADPR